MAVGIEALNLYGGPAYLEVADLFRARGLDMDRFANLMMEKKSVGLPCEDPVTNAVNAAKPIVDRMSEADRGRIETLIVSTESGLDFGKSLSTYIHDYLGLGRNCRLFEVKQACYGGVAAMQSAAHFIASGASPGAKALVVATDMARAAVKHTYAEPSQAVGAAAMLVSDRPHILELDFGAVGACSYEVMDTCRPRADVETGDADLSLLSYLDCLEGSFRVYADKVADAHFGATFDFLCFHTPFAGMVKGAHRKMMRKFAKTGGRETAADFERRVAPSLRYCVEVGNIYSATIFAALCSLIDHAPLAAFNRIGLFSYGSGCSSEFFSGVASAESKRALAEMKISEGLAARVKLDMEAYDRLLDLNMEWIFGVKDKDVEYDDFAEIYDRFMAGRGYLTLKRVAGYHREYDWS